MAKYDVGIFGLWYGNNYGSIITYYALSKVVESLGYSFAMIRNPLGREIDIDSLDRSHPLRFAKEKYNVTPLYHLSEMEKLNDICDRFIIGSDQMWNYHLSRPYKQSYFLDFAHDDKIKISYATSFGKMKYLGPDQEKEITRKNLKRFDAVSVRDDFSQKICEKDFGVKAELVLDPVFLCPESEYEKLISEASDFSIEGDYIFAYILDPNPVIGKSLQSIAEKSGKKVIVVFNQTGNMAELKRNLDITSDNVEFRFSVTVKEWLYLFKNAHCVLTDSFHGTCFSVIFRKKFVTLKNNGRGGARFSFLLNSIGLIDNMIEKAEDFEEKYTKIISSETNYAEVFETIDKNRKVCIDWFIEALEKKKEIPAEKTEVPAEVIEENDDGYYNVLPQDTPVYMAPKNVETPEELHPDIERCRMIVSLLKAYGIKHIVISSGTRNLSIARFFESNDCFTTYRVTDERSAAYFALGLSVKLNFEPVVITCTSGTAVANYLPGVTEAFYQRVPLIIITGDRYPCYIGQMEAQMIKQHGLFDDVCKKSVQLPINWDVSGKWETRRMVCDSILECTHFVNGPVHINVPINIIEHNPPEVSKLALTKVNIIKRTDFYSDMSEWESLVSAAKKAKRIMVIYGQNNPLSDEDKKYFDAFTEKYNCVVLTDHLSNVDNEYCLNPYRLLKKIKSDEFKKELLPDLMIYVGGKRVLNCPLAEKIKSIRRYVKFWHVIEDGSVCDIYRKLTRVIGCSQKQFFKFFAERAGDIHNDGVYCNEWKAAAAKVPKVNMNASVWNNPGKFTSYYTMGKLITSLPKNSMLHLSVGNTFINSQNYPVDPSVTVYCNMGTNGIDGSCSSFIGQCSVDKKLGFLMIGDLSFFYDMNSLWNKKIGPNVRIMLNNDHCAGLLKHYHSRSITHQHGASAEGWVRSLGCFKYICAHNKEEFDERIKEFTAAESDQAIFFEVLFDFTE